MRRAPGPFAPRRAVALAVLLVPGVLLSGGLVRAPSVLLPPMGGVSSFAQPSLDSYNWAGYAATGANGSVTGVSGSWLVPNVTCGASVSLAAVWVGIDGLHSPTVEQVGTLAECSGGSAYYYAWWEMYPSGGMRSVATVTPGDRITAAVTYNGTAGSFRLTLHDLTTGAWFSHLRNDTGTDGASAECIVEAPGGDAQSTSGLYPLADFTRVQFSGCAATVGGFHGTIGLFSSVVEIEMVSDPSATHFLATASNLSATRSFAVTWHRAS